MRPGRPAPTMGPGTATVDENVRLRPVPPCVDKKKVPGVGSKPAKLTIPVPLRFKNPPDNTGASSVRRLNDTLLRAPSNKQPAPQLRSDPAVKLAKLIGVP